MNQPDHDLLGADTIMGLAFRSEEELRQQLEQLSESEEPVDRKDVDAVLTRYGYTFDLLPRDLQELAGNIEVK